MTKQKISLIICFMENNMVTKKTNSTINFIDEKRILNGLTPLVRAELLKEYKTPNDLLRYLESFEDENDLLKFYLQICDNGVVEDFEKLDTALNYHFSDSTYYRALIKACLKDNIIKESDIIYEVKEKEV